MHFLRSKAKPIYAENQMGAFMNRFKTFKTTLCLFLLFAVGNLSNGRAQGTSPATAIRIDLPVFQDSWIVQLKMGERYAVPFRKKADVVWYTFNLEEDLVIYLGQKGTADNKATVELLDQTRKRIWISGEKDTLEGSICNQKLKKGTYFIKVTSIVFSPKPFQIEICKFSKTQTVEAEQQIDTSKRPPVDPEADGWLVINGKKIPADFNFNSLVKLFGQPSRTNKTDRWTIYVHDRLGIAFWTAPGSEAIASLDLSLQDETKLNPHAPKNTFRGSIEIAGRKFPIGQSLHVVTKIFPEFKALPDSFNMFHFAEFGTRRLSLVLNEKGIIQSLGIRLRDKPDVPAPQRKGGAKA
jgi:hypothetical protein